MAGQIGIGATFAGTVASGLTSIAQITSISLPEVSCDDIDVTSMDSTDDAKEFVAGLIDSGSLGLELSYEKSNYSNLLGAVRISDTYTLTFKDGSTLVFTGYLKSVGGDMPVDGKITNSATFKVSGLPVFTAGV